MIELQLTFSGRTRPIRLDDGKHTVGRAGDNTIQIPAGRVSKHHAVLRVAGERLFVSDLGSTNGTEVGGIRVGPDETEVPADTDVSFGGAVLRRATAPASIEKSVLLPDDKLTTVMRYNVRDGYSVKARERIMDFSSELFELLATDQDPVEVEKAACRFVSRCVSADRVVLLENWEEATAVETRARWTKKEDDMAPLQLSTTLVGQVLRERDSILVSNPMEDPNYTGQESVMALNLRSAMAAPLFDNEHVRGILYVDTTELDVRYTQDDLQVLTATANAVAVKLRNLSLESELRTAANIQRSMLPIIEDVDKGFEAEAYQVACREVGGDLYHCIRRPNGRVLLALGDVAGKGMPAALAMSAAIVLIGMLAEIDGKIEDLARHLHTQMYRIMTPEQFITLFIGELDPKSGTLRYVNAGHEPPVIVREDNKVELLDSTGLAIATIEEPMLGGAKVKLHPGDLLAVFSDGIPEATTDGVHFMDAEAVKKILRSHRDEALPEIRKRIVWAVESFLGGEPNSDDVTLLLIRR